MEVFLTHHWGRIENTWWTGRIITVKVVNTAAERNVSSRRNPCQSPQLPNRPDSFHLAPLAPHGNNHRRNFECFNSRLAECALRCLWLGRWQAQYPSCRMSVPSSRSCRLGVTAQRTVQGFIFSHFSLNSGFSLTVCVSSSLVLGK